MRHALPSPEPAPALPAPALSVVVAASPDAGPTDAAATTIGSFRSQFSGKDELEHFRQVRDFIHLRVAQGPDFASEHLSSSLEINQYNDDFWTNLHTAVGMPGLLISVKRIESAIIDPWQIIVEDVGRFYVRKYASLRVRI